MTSQESNHRDEIIEKLVDDFFDMTEAKGFSARETVVAAAMIVGSIAGALPREKIPDLLGAVMNTVAVTTGGSIVVDTYKRTSAEQEKKVH